MNKSLVWKPTGQGYFRCSICPTHESVEARRIAGHEEGRNHKRNLERHDTPAQQASGSTSRGESSSEFQNQPVPAARVRGPLASLLAQVVQDPDPHRHQNNYVDQDTGVVNWDSDLLNFDTHFQDSLEVRTMAQLSENPKEYLRNEGDINHDSDADLEERSNASSSSDDADDVETVGTAQKSCKIGPESMGTEWFPWPDKEVNNKLTIFESTVFNIHLHKQQTWVLDIQRFSL
jgi:hypothetical protein